MVSGRWGSILHLAILIEVPVSMELAPFALHVAGQVGLPIPQMLVALRAGGEDSEGGMSTVLLAGGEQYTAVTAPIAAALVLIEFFICYGPATGLAVPLHVVVRAQTGR